MNKKSIGAILFFISLQCFPGINLEGIIIDSEGYDTVKSAHVMVNNRIKATSDINGRFTIPVNLNDTITFSHLGFLQDPVIISDSVINSPMPVIFKIKIKYYEIDEVKVFRYHDYQSFKQDFMSQAENKGLIEGEELGETISEQVLMGYAPEYDSYQNYRHELNLPKRDSPQILFYSSSGNMGISGFLKSFKRKRR